jgi:hypothetical protein
VSNKLIIVMIHGQGNQKKEYYEKLRDGLFKRLTSAEKQRIVVAPIFYQDLVSDPDGEMWARMKAKPLSYQWLRQPLFEGFSDASTYQFRDENPQSSYKKVHKRINSTLQSAVDELTEPGEDGPGEYKIIAFAHSLGGQILSNHIWDAQRTLGIWDGVGAGPHEDFSKLGKFITYGCNIPLFVSGRIDAKPIAAPSENFEWHNYYDKHDVLGWPLKPISNGYNDIVEDVHMNAGGWFLGLTPKSHSEYTGNKKFLKLSVQHIRDLLD